MQPQPGRHAERGGPGRHTPLTAAPSRVCSPARLWKGTPWGWERPKWGSGLRGSRGGTQVPQHAGLCSRCSRTPYTTIIPLSTPAETEPCPASLRHLHLSNPLPTLADRQPSSPVGGPASPSAQTAAQQACDTRHGPPARLNPPTLAPRRQPPPPDPTLWPRHAGLGTPAGQPRGPLRLLEPAPAEGAPPEGAALAAARRGLCPGPGGGRRPPGLQRGPGGGRRPHQHPGLQVGRPRARRDRSASCRAAPSAWSPLGCHSCQTTAHF